MRRRALAAILALACIAALGGVPLLASANLNDVSADAQISANGTVVAETAYVAADAWLAVYADDDGSRGELLGVRRLDGAGFRTDVPVAIDDAAWRQWDEGEARTIHVALHEDGGGGGFDRDEDPILSSFGRAATDSLVLGRGATAYVGAKAFRPQATDDPTVTVRRIQLPTDGYLVARNVTDSGAESEAAAEPVGATALASGTHTNVTVRLNESYFERQGSRVRIAFSLYGDDGDGTFDAGDEPVRAGTESVTTIVFLDRTGASGGGDERPTETADGRVVTTATPTDEDDDSSIVTTASPADAATDGRSATAGANGTGPTSTDGGSEATGTDGESEATSTDGQPGFGASAAVLAVALGVAAGVRRRRT